MGWLVRSLAMSSANTTAVAVWRVPIAGGIWCGSATAIVGSSQILRQRLGARRVHVAAYLTGVLSAEGTSLHRVLPKLKCRRNAGAPLGRHRQQHAPHNPQAGLKHWLSWNRLRVFHQWFKPVLVCSGPDFSPRRTQFLLATGY